MKDATDFLLAFGMLATGSINTIVTKLADSVCQRNELNQPLLYNPKDSTVAPFWGPPGSYSNKHALPGTATEDMYKKGGGLEDYECIELNHPFVQAAFMFIGEVLCGVVYVVLRCFGKGAPMPY
eukprot:COSAG01_NODE_13638_length_1555_cov_1.052885_2_plen_123_part_01